MPPSPSAAASHALGNFRGAAGAEEATGEGERRRHTLGDAGVFTGGTGAVEGRGNNSTNTTIIIVLILL